MDSPDPLASDAKSIDELVKMLAKTQKEPLAILKVLKEAQQRDGSDSTQSSAILAAELTSYKVQPSLNSRLYSIPLM